MRYGLGYAVWADRQLTKRRLIFVEKEEEGGREERII